MNKKQYTLEEFEWVWKDSSVYDILNQFYYEHIELQKLLQQIDQLTNNWNELEEFIKFQRKVSLGLNNGYGVSLCDIFLNKMKEIKDGNNE